MTFDYDLKKLKNREHLLKYIGVCEEDFNRILKFDYDAYERSLEPDEDGRIAQLRFPVFWRHELPKRNINRGVRTVWEAAGEFNNIYKAVARRLTLFFEQAIDGFPHPKCIGYVRGKNIRDNASFHVGSTRLLKADIKDFFPSISQARLTGLFVSLGVAPTVAQELAQFLCIDERLPLGLPSSPILANAVCHQMDIDLDRLGEATGSVYSRYSDDLSFSSRDKVPDPNDVASIVRRHGFEIASEKTRSLKRGQNFYVTGLSVSEKESPHAPKRKKRELRQELYYAKKFGLTDHISHLGIDWPDEQQRYINHLDGRVKYIAFHEPQLAKTIVPLWQAILDEDGQEPSFEPKKHGDHRFSIFVDETEFDLAGKQYLALGLSTTQHQSVLDTRTKKTLEDFLASPWADGDLEAIRANGIHFCDATEDLKKRYIEELQTLPFNGYIAFAEMDGPAQYEETYLKILRKIIRRRLIAADGQYACFSFEENDKVSRQKIQEEVTNAHQSLAESNNRRPERCYVRFVGKTFFGVSVPDFILGAFRRYIKRPERSVDRPREDILFEMLRDKIRLIINVDSGEEFSRRNPLRNGEL